MSMIIAEIGTSHEGNEEKARKLIDAALDSGSDAVKFQWVYADEILHPKTGFVNLPTGNIPLYNRFQQLECSPDFYKRMADYTRSRGGKFICSPFGIRSLKELLSLNPHAIKIASPELNHLPMLNYLAEYRLEEKKNGKGVFPVILSSGVSKLKDIERAIEILGRENVTLLHCITSYPAPEDEYNVKLVRTLKNIFGIETGISDHSLNPILVPVLSVLCGGSVIEKHITLSKKTSGLDDPVALEPEEFAIMVHCVHQAEAALARYGQEKGKEIIIKQLSESFDEDKIFRVLGDGVKKLAASELNNYGRTNRSLHYMKDLKAGTILSSDDFALLRTEKVLTPGIGSEYIEKILGAKLLHDVQNGAGIQFEDFI